MSLLDRIGIKVINVRALIDSNAGGRARILNSRASFFGFLEECCQVHVSLLSGVSRVPGFFPRVNAQNFPSELIDIFANNRFFREFEH